MTQTTDIPLILGGHSFISQLGSDPPASDHEQRQIVQTCLDNGITWFDTTYMPERIALGKLFRLLGRRNEATILAWNFFTDFSPGDPVGEPEYYRPRHIDLILEQLQSDYVDVLVVVPLPDVEKNQRQKELAIEWHNKGYARALGLWIQDAAVLDHHGKRGPFRFAIRPWNIATPEAAPVFATSRANGWDNVATSPFVRGWQLDRIVLEASRRGYGDPEAVRPVIADLMLRYSLFQPNVDRLIVAIRKVQWISRNRESISRGPLTAEEHRWLQKLQISVSRKRRWWQWPRGRS